MTPTLDEAAPIVDVVDVDRPAPAGAEAGGQRRVAVTLDDVEKRFGDVVAVTGVNLELGEGECFSMLGPSGSGKTTTLRLIAGFETLTRGRISLYGRDVSKIPAFERDVNTVFQDYALFPHMNVYENVGYGLMVRHVPGGERTSRVAEALRRVRLAGFEDRRPSQLSGGQRQRVALARALVNRPKVLLLDEPLGALDRKLREEMQVELKEIQRQVGITFVFVTHDQDEALSMSDRVAVFNAGSVEQVGTPTEIYEHPATEFVAGFVGTSNVIEGDVARRIVGQPGRFSVRPEKIRVAPAGSSAGPGEHSVAGRIRDIVYLGAQTRYLVTVDGDVDFVVATQNLTSPAEGIDQRGREVQLVWDKRNTLTLAPSEQEATSRRTGS